MVFATNNLDEVRSVLEIAAVFARNFDLSGAVVRAREAVRVARDPDAYDEARLMLREFEAKERAWRAAVGADALIYDTEELAAAEVDDARPAARIAVPQRRSTWTKLVSRLRQEERQTLA